MLTDVSKSDHEFENEPFEKPERVALQLLLDATGYSAMMFGWSILSAGLATRAAGTARSLQARKIAQKIERNIARMLFALHIVLLVLIVAHAARNELTAGHHAEDDSEKSAVLPFLGSLAEELVLFEMMGAVAGLFSKGEW